MKVYTQSIHQSGLLQSSEARKTIWCDIVSDVLVFVGQPGTSMSVAKIVVERLHACETDINVSYT